MVSGVGQFGPGQHRIQEGPLRRAGSEPRVVEIREGLRLDAVGHDEVAASRTSPGDPPLTDDFRAEPPLGLFLLRELLLLKCRTPPRRDHLAAQLEGV
jgi:hypothetical protein